MERRKLKNINENVKNVENVDSNLRVNISSEENILPYNDINYVVNANKVFNEERNASNNYRFIFTLSPLFSNCLYNVSGTKIEGTYGETTISKEGHGLETFDSKIFKEDLNDDEIQGFNDFNYEDSIREYLLERDGWFLFRDPDITRFSLCNHFDLEPTRERFDLSNLIYNNWSYYMTYPSRSENEHILVNGGLLINEVNSTIIKSSPRVEIGVSTYHGLEKGDTISIEGMLNEELNGTFKVETLGKGDGTMKSNYFIINLDFRSLTNINDDYIFNDKARLFRVVNGMKSDYYVRVFKKLTQTKNYDLNPLAFSKTIFKDDMVQLIFNEDVDLSDYLDNLGRPITEVFLTKIKNNSSKISDSQDGMFYKIKDGFDLEYTKNNILNDVSNIRLVIDSTDSKYVQHQPITPTTISQTTSIVDSQDEFYGDICEYNKTELIEKVLTNVMHRFNTIDRISGNDKYGGDRQEGYMYEPHYNIKLREYSDYIERGDADTFKKPFYSQDLNDGRFIWRDIMSLGFTNNEEFDYPFTNGYHYIHRNHTICATRQDPFSVYGLYYKTRSEEGRGGITNFIKGDPFGDSKGKEFKIFIGDEEC